MNLTRTFQGVEHRKSSFSGAGNDCTYLDRHLTGVADSKSGNGLLVGRTGILALVTHLR